MGVIEIFGVYVCVIYKYRYFLKNNYNNRGYISIRFASILFNVIIFLVWKGITKMFEFYVYAFFNVILF